MPRGFIKLMRSEEGEFLQEHYPDAFLLLCQIAMRARRTKGGIDGLEIGEARIGDYKKAGIKTERKYRTGKAVLVRLGLIEVVETGRKRAISTTRSATKGTLVRLLNSTIWDVNAENSDEQIDDQAAIERRANDDEQEREEFLRKNKKFKKGEEGKRFIPSPLSPNSLNFKNYETTESKNSEIIQSDKISESQIDALELVAPLVRIRQSEERVLRLCCEPKGFVVEELYEALSTFFQGKSDWQDNPKQSAFQTLKQEWVMDRARKAQEQTQKRSKLAYRPTTLAPHISNSCAQGNVKIEHKIPIDFEKDLSWIENIMSTRRNLQYEGRIIMERNQVSFPELNNAKFRYGSDGFIGNCVKAFEEIGVKLGDFIMS